jgi:hypothetical protein
MVDAPKSSRQEFRGDRMRMFEAIYAIKEGPGKGSRKSRAAYVAALRHASDVASDMGDIQIAGRLASMARYLERDRGE